MSGQPLREEYRAAVTAVAKLLVDGQYAEAGRLAPSRLTAEELEQAMHLTNEELHPPTQFRKALQLGEGAGAELFVPFETSNSGAADLELQLQVNDQGRLVIWDILVP